MVHIFFRLKLKEIAKVLLLPLGPCVTIRAIRLQKHVIQLLMLIRLDKNYRKKNQKKQE